MSDVNTGSALLDELRAKRDRIHAKWGVSRHTISSPNKPLPHFIYARLPRVEKRSKPSLSERIAQAKKLSGISEKKLHWIINAIYGSARDRGEYIVNESPEITSPGDLTIENIQTNVAECYNLTREELLSLRRCARVMLPRHIAMYLSIKLTPHNYQYIGKRFGYDHSTIIHAVRKIEKMIASDKAFAQEIEMLRRELS